MGSAAPSLRRWTSVLLLAAVALLVAFGIRIAREGLPGDENADESRDRATPNSGLVAIDASALDPADLAVEVSLEDGWVVPELVDPLDDHLHRRPAGSAARGARVAIPEGAATLVVRGDADEAALRFVGTENEGSRGWTPLSLSRFDTPDGLAGEEGSGPSVPSSLPSLIPEGEDTLELVMWEEGINSVEVIFLPSFARLDDTGFEGPAGPRTATSPAVIPRSDWANLTWRFATDGCSDGPRQSDRLQALVVHHTVTTNAYTESQVPELLRAILYSHTQINGWCDIAYNFVVDRFGRIWEGRTGSAAGNVIGGHARGFNTGTLGVAMLGQHHAGARPAPAVPSSAATEAVEAIAAWKLIGAGVDPQGRTWLRNRSYGQGQKLQGRGWHLVPTILGHQDLGFTSCPGSHGVAVVAGLGQRVSNYIDRDVLPDWSTWVSTNHGPGFAVADIRGGLRPAGSAVAWSQDSADAAAPVVAVGGNPEGGYLLTSDGALLGFGASPAVPSPVLTSAAVDVAVRSDGRSGWILSARERIRGFGGAADLSVEASISEPVALAADDLGRGYVLDATGRLDAVGSYRPAAVSLAPTARGIDVTLRPAGGGWVLDSDGRLHGFGGAPDHRVTLDPSESGSAVAVVAAPVGDGGWVVDRSGQFLPFGGARYILAASTDAESGDVVDAALVGTITGADFRTSDDARYVDRVHEIFLDRPATDEELDLGVTELEQGERDNLVGSLVRSDAWVGAEIDAIYANVLGRSPDPAGRNYWLNEVEAGLDVADLGTYFYGSVEYARGSGDLRNYVRNLYQVLLGREPDLAGWNYWVTELESGRAAPPDVAAGFYGSIESRRQRAARLYSRIVGTPVDAVERDALADRLGQVGDLDFAIELAGDSSFYELVVEGPPP